MHFRFTLRQKSDAEAVIASASDIGRSMIKVPHDDGCKFCLAIPQDELLAHPGVITSARAEGSRSELSREVLSYEQFD